MLSYRTPGVYFERPLARPPLRRLRTDVAGFVGIARAGPLHYPVKVESWPEFTAVFGGHTVQGYLAYAVEGFFANGGRACWVVRVADPATARGATLDLLDGGGTAVGRLTATSPGSWAHEVAVTAIGTSASRFTLVVRPATGAPELWRELSLDPADERFVGKILNDVDQGSRLLRLCEVEGAANARLRAIEGGSDAQRMAGGADGLAALTAEHFLGAGGVPDPCDPCEGRTLPPPPPSQVKPEAALDAPLGLGALEAVDEVSLVALPDASSRPRLEVVPRPTDPRCDVLPDPDAVPLPPTPAPASPELPPIFDAVHVSRLQQGLVAHCELLRDRVALLDVPPLALGGGDAPAEVIVWTRGFSPSHWAAAYYPWLSVPEPLDTGALLAAVPPCGHVAGAIARSDISVGVHKPPANLRLQTVEDVAFAVDDARHGDLNDAGINVIRPYLGRGIRLAGARTLDREPAQRYVNVRRLLIFIAESIDEQLQWTVFEPNNRRLWRQVDRVVRAFLLGLWRDGMLDGSSVEEAFHVLCDESTNPPSETDAGRLTCEIGVLPPWPAEFVVARLSISQAGVDLIEDSAANGAADA